ncbi:hypothetical protein ACFL5Z_10710 [Planctomycetota bacterium]
MCRIFIDPQRFTRCRIENTDRRVDPKSDVETALPGDEPESQVRRTRTESAKLIGSGPYGSFP